MKRDEAKGNVLPMECQNESRFSKDFKNLTILLSIELIEYR